MNGEKLPVNHGFPVRALIPGWYGMDSVKWLRSIDVLDGRAALPGLCARGPFTASGPAARRGGNCHERQIRVLAPARRRNPVWPPLQLRGAAWAGENRVRRVDGLNRWRRDRGSRRGSSPKPKPYAWVCWSHEWKIAGPGSYQLVVTATDDQGRRAAGGAASNRIDDYEWNQRQIDPGDRYVMRSLLLISIAAGLAAQALGLLEQADEAFRQGDFERASALAQRALESDPAAVHGHMILGVIAAQKNQWEVSNRHFQTVVKLDPSNPYGYFYLGQAKLYQRQWDAAIGFFTRLSSGSIRRPAACLVELALAQNEAGHPEEALATLGKTTPPADPRTGRAILRASLRSRDQA